MTFLEASSDLTPEFNGPYLVNSCYNILKDVLVLDRDVPSVNFLLSTECYDCVVCSAKS